MNMTIIYSLTCPACGGKLQITSDIDRFACEHCGNKHIVQRSGGIVTLSPLIEGLKNVQAGVDKTASELAIIRLKKEIFTLRNELIQEDKLNNDDIILLNRITIGAFVISGMALILLQSGQRGIPIW